MKASIYALGTQARKAAAALALCSAHLKNQALVYAAEQLRQQADRILDANARDMKNAGTKGLSESMLDRLALDPSRIEAMASGIEAIAKLDDPVGQIIKSWKRPNGLTIERRRVPLGVIGIIYESRPNVTADAAALCVKSGNAAILRGGSESFASSTAIHACLQQAFESAGLPVNSVQMIPTADRAAVGMLLSGLDGTVDLIVPRGGRNLIKRVQQDARVPVIGHLEGICHVYVDRSADRQRAVDIVINSKMRRTGVCGAAETLLLDSGLDDATQSTVLNALLDSGCEVRGDAALSRLDKRVIAASDADFGHEFLGPVIAAKCVDGVASAIGHIQQYGSGHTESIVAEDPATVADFLNQVDSAIVMHNASTQFADGGEFGMGAEIGIATGKLHARGPVGVEQLTSYKYVVHGTGQIRPV